MATRRKADEAEDELEELEDLEIEADDELEEEPEGETFSAKEAANKLGVDARTFRKFLRSKFGKIGQGNRWLIEAEEFDALKEEFDAWHKPKAVKIEVTEDDTPDEVLDELEEFDEFEELDELENA